MAQIVELRNRDRFVAPHVDASTVPRDRLDPRYEQAQGQVLRVLAPGGYGKSTQVARWSEHDQRPRGWVDLERFDNDPFVLAPVLARALATIGGDGEVPRFEGTPAELQAAFRTLVQALTSPFVLILDDVHHVEDAESLTLIATVAAHLSPTSTLVICGRSHPGEAQVARLRLRPGVVDVTADDLALDEAETDQLLQELGIELEPDALAALAARFEGWPAGLRLAALVLRTEGPDAWRVPDRAGDTTYVVDYLRHEWTGGLPDEDLRFLRELACLERFTGPMCDQVLGREGSLAALRALHRNEFVVLPLDQRDEWFRMHPVLAGWLSTELATVDPARYRAIHVAARTWWEAQGDIDLAFEHAIAIEDWDAAEALISRHCAPFFSRGLYATIRRWLGRFGNDRVKESPALCGLYVLSALAAGDPTSLLQWLDQLERILRTRPADDPHRRRATVIRALVAPGRAADTIGPAREVAAGDENDEWRAWALLSLAGNQLLTGDGDAFANFLEGAFVAELNELQAIRANCLAGASISADLDGDRERSIDLARQSWAALTESRAEFALTTAAVNAVHALAEARAGNRTVAAAEVTTSIEKLRGLDGLATWVNVLSRLALLRTTLLLDDRDRSRTLLRELDRHLRDEPHPNALTPTVESLREKVDAVTARGNGPDPALSEAELRVLVLLPTNLKLGDIGSRLYISRNTVKTQVASIYRKLGASSRGEAVDLARKAGILEDG